jgi:DnaJ-class molecular chaperone
MMEACKVCNGERHIKSRISAEPSKTGILREVCSDCKGTGRLDGHKFTDKDIKKAVEEAYADLKAAEAKKLESKIKMPAAKKIIVD